jgi:hydroxymethylbilane synthase
MTFSRTLVVGTRGSALALTQTGMVVDALRALHPGLDVEVRRITTKGDVMRDVPLANIGGRGVFVDAIEWALRDREIDLAVHSAKDLPSTLPGDMAIAAVPERADARDVLVANGMTLETLPPGARVGTSSLRRAGQLRARRPDLDVREMRGNVDTRLAKLARGEYDAIVLAAAGLIRLGLADHVSEWLDMSLMLPSPGQGALALEIRKSDRELAAFVAPLTHTPTERALIAVRAFLARLGAGCAAAVGAHAVLGDPETLELTAFIGAEDGRMVRDSIAGPPEFGAELGLFLADQLVRAGGDALIAEAGARREA